MLDYLLDAFIDSLSVFIFAFIIYFILSFFERKIINLFNKKGALAPLTGATLGIIPQCGISVLASELYLKKYISMGTLIAIFIACSDEAIPIIISNPSKIIMVIPLIISKLLIAFAIGLLVDVILKKEINNEEYDGYLGCHCDSQIHTHILHPLVHALKIFFYVLIVNVIFGLIIYLITEEALIGFLNSNRYLSPLLSMLIGLIPNCASSVIITELFLMDGISFGACLAGLICNSGLGLIYLFKKRDNIKNALNIITIISLTSLIFGYLTCLIFGF